MNTDQHRWDTPYGPLVRLWHRLTGRRCVGHLVSLEALREGQPIQCAYCGTQWAGKLVATGTPAAH